MQRRAERTRERFAGEEILKPVEDIKPYICENARERSKWTLRKAHLSTLQSSFQSASEGGIAHGDGQLAFHKMMEGGRQLKGVFTIPGK